MRKDTLNVDAFLQSLCSNGPVKTQYSTIEQKFNNIFSHQNCVGCTVGRV